MALGLRPHSPEILPTNDDARAVVLEIPAGRPSRIGCTRAVWVTVIDGEVELTTPNGEKIAGDCGLMVEFAPRERHAVLVHSTGAAAVAAHPWPGRGLRANLDIGTP